MRKIETRIDKISKKINALKALEYDIIKERDTKIEELKKYHIKHQSIDFGGLATSCVPALKKIYEYMDKRYPIEWQGGLRCDDRGMALTYWIDDDPDYLILHLTSNHTNVIFSGSTSWIVKAPTLQDKIGLLKKIKKDIIKIIEEK